MYPRRSCFRGGFIALFDNANNGRPPHCLFQGQDLPIDADVQKSIDFCPSAYFRVSEDLALGRRTGSKRMRIAGLVTKKNWCEGQSILNTDTRLDAVSELTGVWVEIGY